MKGIVNFASGISCIIGTFVIYSAAQKYFVGSSSERQVFLSSVNEGKVKSAEERNVLFNDPTMQTKWGMNATDVHRAWELSKGSKDVVVAVCDTGIDANHKDLHSNLWTNPGETGVDQFGRDKATNGVDDDHDGYVDDVHGWNFAGNNNDLTDNHGHGTHIAGIIAAQGNNSYGITGVAPNVSLMILKYYDPKAPGANNLKNTIECFKYATKLGANIINYSGGGTEFSQEEHDAVQAAAERGILFVAAAGNERSNSDEKDKHYYPADYGLTNIISVTAVNRESLSVLPSSNYGVRTVDLAAPGENIYSTMPGGGFGYMTGTSQATAFVTGVAALIMSNKKDFDYTEVKKYILRNGDEYPTLLSKTGTAKLLNSYKALASLDRNVSANGSVVANTSTMGTRSFASSQNLKDPKLNTSAMNNTNDRTEEPAESLAQFSRQFLKAIEDSAQTPNQKPNL